MLRLHVFLLFVVAASPPPGQRGLGLCTRWNERKGWGAEGVDSESAFCSCHSLWGFSIRSCPKNSNGRRFKCKTASFGAAASL